jgi:hypothetical protein
MAIRTLIILLAAAFTYPSFAQTKGTESTTVVKDKFDTDLFGIGLNASLTSGMGVSFKHHLGGIPFAYQLSGGYLQLGDDQVWSFGGELHFDLNVAHEQRLYAVGGMGYYYIGDSTNTMDHPLRWGLGVGYEFPLKGSLTISVNIMITGKQFGNNILPLPSAALHYYFQ